MTECAFVSGDWSRSQHAGKIRVFQEPRTHWSLILRRWDDPDRQYNQFSDRFCGFRCDQAWLGPLKGQGPSSAEHGAIDAAIGGQTGRDIHGNHLTL
jgi:hypothetical protein